MILICSKCRTIIAYILGDGTNESRYEICQSCKEILKNGQKDTNLCKETS